ncbi:MAG: hypothetical protein BJ554DRAFT_7924 [Olpidium bornovanus]|uniref:Uncharacterized protein n=1 Tax=Olpidium bornovanus TaxID=278681 RepID=A0A8H8DIX0_9FUNG|nr:MAG: hypothetical protein BJ554DRAFT_7924 [Olpidium bornovanus]
MAGEQDPGSRHAPSALLPAAAGGAVASACPQERRPFLPAFPLRIARVRQLDADLLDDELFGLLKDELGDGLKLFKVCSALPQL